MKDAILAFAERAIKTKDLVKTEEATKNALIMPFLQLMGYDVFNPLEIVPEFTADVGSKAGERVDYAIILDDKPVMLIECKSCSVPLDISKESQLLRYFHTTSAKFGVLTNGIEYKFYSDLAEPNKMDLVPFLSFSLEHVDKINFVELAKFCKENFDAENIRKTAELLKCSGAIKAALEAELDNPSEDLVRLIFKKTNPKGVFNEKQKERLTPLVKSTLTAIISDRVKKQLDAALNHTQNKEEENIVEPTTADDGIVTNESELEGFRIIRAIAAEIIPADDIAIRDAKSYCAVLYKDNNRKPVIRFYFNNEDKKSIVLFDADAEERIYIDNVSELYSFKKRIHTAIQKYLNA